MLLEADDSQGRGVPSVSLTADNSLCGGSQGSDGDKRCAAVAVIKRARPLRGRGGSVSRRALNPKTRKRAHLSWGRKLEGKVKPIPSHSSGEGVWGRGASLREAASPPESNSHLFPDVLHALVEHRANVAVGEGVENDFALAAALDQTSLLE